MVEFVSLETCYYFQNEEESTEPPQFAVINRNDKSRIRKKCNLDSGSKRVHIIDDVIITNVPKIKSCEPLLEGNNTNNTLVLSPSKFNANKRSLVENPEGSEGMCIYCILYKDILRQEARQFYNLHKIMLLFLILWIFYKVSTFI